MTFQPLCHDVVSAVPENFSYISHDHNFFLFKEDIDTGQIQQQLMPVTFAGNVLLQLLLVAENTVKYTTVIVLQYVNYEQLRQN